MVVRDLHKRRNFYERDLYIVFINLLYVYTSY